MKPTYGRVSRYGIVAFASSLDQIGPFARDVRDAAALLHAVAGRDDRDSTSSPEPVPATLTALPAGDDEAAGSLRGKRLGLPREYFVAGMEPGVEARVREAVAALEAAGATVEEVSLPHTDYGLATYYIVAPAEASANLARYDGIRYGPRLGDGDVLANYLATRGQGFGAEVKRRIMLGTYALSAGYYDAYYLKAQKVRTLIKGDFDALWAQGFDALVAPTSPTVAFRFGERLADPVSMYLSDACTLPVNMAGLPGVSIPCGLSDGPAGRAPADRRRLVRGGAPRAGAGLRGDHRRCADWRTPRADSDPASARAIRLSRALRERMARDGADGAAMATETRPDSAARPAGRPRARAARPGRPAVRDPPLLRHRGDDGRRHQPRRRRARLRHAAGDRRGRRREPARGPDALHQQLGHARAATRAVATSRDLYGVRYDPANEILITVGASEAVDLALRATCDPGDEVILHEPSYVAYVPAIVFAGGVVRHVATRFEDDFALDPAAVEAAITPRTKALFLGYPCNPTGAVLPDEVPDALAEIAVRHDLLVYSDEIYDRLAYGRTVTGR